MAISRAPWMGSVSLTTGSTVYNLWTLLSAIVTNNPANKSPKAEYLSIQFNVDAGSAKLYIGNSALSTSFAGIVLYAGQAWQTGMVSNLIKLDDIYVMSDTNTMQVNVAFITR